MTAEPTPHELAASIAQAIKTTPPCVIAQMQEAFRKVNTPGKQQATLDALSAFGVTAVQALGVYAAAYAFVDALGLSDQLIAPNLQTFQPQADGISVLYVEPEPITIPPPGATV